MPMKILITSYFQLNAYKKHTNKKLVIHINSYNATNDVDVDYNRLLREPWTLWYKRARGSFYIRNYGLFPYINTSGKTFEVDGKYTYAIDEETRLVEDGETKAMGIVEILATLAKGDKVEVKDNVITRESTELSRKIAKVEELLLALPTKDKVVYGDKAQIEAARAAFTALGSDNAKVSEKAKQALRDAEEGI